MCGCVLRKKIMLLTGFADIVLIWCVKSPGITTGKSFESL